MKAANVTNKPSNHPARTGSPVAPRRLAYITSTQEEEVENSTMHCSTLCYASHESFIITYGTFSLGSIKVHCDMSHPTEVVTTVYHDGGERTYVTGYSESVPYLKYFDYYGASKGQINALKDLSSRCEQFVTIECYAVTGGIKEDYWISIDGKHIPWVNTEQSDCKCSLDQACRENKTQWVFLIQNWLVLTLSWQTDIDCRCNCAQSDGFVPRQWTIDQGYLTSVADLPVMGIRLSKTNFIFKNAQYYTIGPLKCYQSMLQPYHLGHASSSLLLSISYIFLIQMPSAIRTDLDARMGHLLINPTDVWCRKILMVSWLAAGMFRIWTAVVNISPIPHHYLTDLKDFTDITDWNEKYFDQ